MSENISAAFGIDPVTLDAAGIFDRFLGIDSQLHVDPHLLSDSREPEFVAAAKTLEQYWRDTIVVLKNVHEDGDRFWREAKRRFTFPENPNAGLGYANKGTAGAAVGDKTAKSLVKTAREIVLAGITDPKVFELVGLFESGVGPDIISDITIHIIKPHVLEFTARISKELKLSTSNFDVDGAKYALPRNPETGDYLILWPKEILCDLPVADSWEQIDIVCKYNEQLRERLNDLIGANWRRATKDNSKQELLKSLLTHPEAIVDLVRQYKEKPKSPYDFRADILGETICFPEAQKATSQFPLQLPTQKPGTAADVFEIVKAICEQFRHLVEDCGLGKHFWVNDKHRNERFAQLLFFCIADCYCKANNLDLSPESNSGRGPIDFKISNAYTTRTLVEIKLSSNTRLVHGFETQLEEYSKAEAAANAIFLVIMVKEAKKAMSRIRELVDHAATNNIRTPELIVIDGRTKDSASKYTETI